MILDGLSVLVTGASGGIGRGIALAAAAAGARVMVTAIDGDAAESVAAEIQTRGDTAAAAICNVTNRTEVEASVARTVTLFGRLDAIVHNANSAHASRPTPVEEITDENWDDQVAVGLRAIHLLARAGFAELRRSKGSLVVLTSSSGIEATAGIPVYSAVKGAQRGMVKSLARELGPLGVRVNALAPSAVTPAVGRYLERQPDMREWMLTRASLRRLGESETDIGRAVAFLLGHDSAFITGQTLLVSGGSLMI